MYYHLKKFSLLQSTNDYAKKMLETMAYPGLVIVAKQQTNGRGQRGRIWVSPPGNLYCSIIINPISPSIVGQIAYVTAVALGKTILHFGNNLNIEYKWPNDILLDQKKVAGILIENFENGTIIGIGVNLYAKPDGVSIPTTCLNGVIDANVDVFLNRLLLEFDSYFNQWQVSGFSFIRTLWLKRAWSIGKEHTTPSGINGVIKSIDEYGFLEIITNEGKVLRTS